MRKQIENIFALVIEENINEAEKKLENFLDQNIPNFKTKTPSLMFTIPNIDKLAHILNTIGYNEQNAGNYDKAIEYFNLAKNFYRALPDKSKSADIFHDLAGLYYNISVCFRMQTLDLENYIINETYENLIAEQKSQLFLKEKNSLKKAIKQYEDIPKKDIVEYNHRLAVCHYNLAINYERDDRLNNALIHNNQARKYASKAINQDPQNALIELQELIQDIKIAILQIKDYLDIKKQSEPPSKRQKTINGHFESNSNSIFNTNTFETIGKLNPYQAGFTDNNNSVRREDTASTPDPLMHNDNSYFPNYDQDISMPESVSSNYFKYSPDHTLPILKCNMDDNQVSNNPVCTNSSGTMSDSADNFNLEEYVLAQEQNLNIDCKLTSGFLNDEWLNTQIDINQNESNNNPPNQDSNETPINDNYFTTNEISKPELGPWTQKVLNSNNKSSYISNVK